MALELNLTEIIITLFGGGSILAYFVQDWLRRRRPSVSKADEESVIPTEESQLIMTPQDDRAMELAQKAMDMASRMSEELSETQDRLSKLESKLGIVSRAYRDLYWWAQHIIVGWEEVSERADPPVLPDTVHYPHKE